MFGNSVGWQIWDLRSGSADLAVACIIKVCTHGGQSSMHASFTVLIRLIDTPLKLICGCERPQVLQGVATLCAQPETGGEICFLSCCPAQCLCSEHPHHVTLQNLTTQDFEFLAINAVTLSVAFEVSDPQLNISKKLGRLESLSLSSNPCCSSSRPVVQRNDGMNHGVQWLPQFVLKVEGLLQIQQSVRHLC